MDNPLVQPDVGLYIWTIITFLTLLWALRKYAWGPLLRALDARQETIRKSLDEAEQARKELAQAQETATKVITDARVEAQSILAESRSAAEAFKEESRQQAKAEAEAVVAAAQRRIQQETARAMQEIRRETVDLSLQIAVEAHPQEPHAGRQRHPDQGVARPDRRTALAARGGNPALHREQRGARLTRREEGAYWAYVTDPRTTQSGGMHRCSNAAGTSTTGC